MGVLCDLVVARQCYATLLIQACASQSRLLRGRHGQRNDGMSRVKEAASALARNETLPVNVLFVATYRRLIVETLASNMLRAFLLALPNRQTIERPATLTNRQRLAKLTHAGVTLLFVPRKLECFGCCCQVLRVATAAGAITI